MCMTRTHLESGVGFRAMIVRGVLRLTLVMKYREVYPIGLGFSIWLLITYPGPKRMQHPSIIPQFL